LKAIALGIPSGSWGGSNEWRGLKFHSTIAFLKLRIGVIWLTLAIALTPPVRQLPSNALPKLLIPHFFN
jgi:hypothetical protein